MSADEVTLLSDIKDLIRETLVREQETGFVPNHHVPLTELSDKPIKPKQKQGENQSLSAKKPPETREKQKSKANANKRGKGSRNKGTK